MIIKQRKQGNKLTSTPGSRHKRYAGCTQVSQARKINEMQEIRGIRVSINKLKRTYITEIYPEKNRNNIKYR